MRVLEFGIIFSIIFLIGLMGIQNSFAESGNTQLTVTADLGSSIEVEMEDPDGLRVADFSTGGGILFGCSVTTHTASISKALLPFTITMGDCQDPADQTGWEITETSATCVSGSCLPQCVIPSTGLMDITSSCRVSNDATAPGNVIVRHGAVMTIESDVIFDINFSNFNLTVKSGGGVLIKEGGKVT